MNDKPPRLVLFDVDGTLLKSHGGALRATTRAARRLFGPTFDLEAVDRNGRLDPNIIAAALELNGVEATSQELDAFRDMYVAELRTEVESIRRLPGALQLLEKLRRASFPFWNRVAGRFGPD